MTISRRQLLKGAGAVLAARAVGVSPAAASSIRPHYMVLVTLRGGYDSVMSVAPKDQRVVGDNIHCGFGPDERVPGHDRMFGPLIGGLERHDRDLCLIHGVRSDTTSHKDGLAMLMRGAIGARAGRVDRLLSGALPGDAPIHNFDLAAPDGSLPFREGSRPGWAAIRADVHRRQILGLGAGDGATKGLLAARAKLSELERFLDAARRDATELDGRFSSSLGQHLRLAYQAIAGNWVRCSFLATRANWFDSHSDHVRFQRQRQPVTLADIATFIDLLKSTRNVHGTLFEQTTLAVYSEFGRFPRLNAERGKDHWPDNSWILCGKGVRGGVTVGGTDLFGKGERIDYRTGTVDGRDGRPIFIDNAFATLAMIAGADPVRSGYGRDSVLGCVVA